MAKAGKWKTRAKALEAENRALQQLVNTLVKQLSARETIDSILGGLAPLITGYQADPRAEANRLNELVTAMGNQGLDEYAGVGEQQWFPDVEFDEHMEDETRWPTSGTMRIPSTTANWAGNETRTRTTTWADGGPTPPQGGAEE